ncbi:MAG: hypothetical protein PHE41_04815 [Eubacteriales bacterium]|nr:hypothetical protein [Eubacteriales bacterium]
MEELELKDLRQSFGYGDDGVLLKKNIFGGYNKNEVEETIRLLNRRLEEVKHIRNDETILKENLCLQNQIEENRKEIEELRVLVIQKDEMIIQKKQEIEMINSKAQADLNLAYRTMEFRMEKIKSILADFQDTTAEIDKTIHNKLEGIARQNDR